MTCHKITQGKAHTSVLGLQCATDAAGRYALLGSIWCLNLSATTVREPGVQFRFRSKSLWFANLSLCGVERACIPVLVVHRDRNISMEYHRETCGLCVYVCRLAKPGWLK